MLNMLKIIRVKGAVEVTYVEEDKDVEDVEDVEDIENVEDVKDNQS